MINYPRSNELIGYAGKILAGHDCIDDNPTGGKTTGEGFTIRWQDGPRGRDANGDLDAANGAFVEDVIIAAANRLSLFQASKYACAETADALDALREALKHLAARRARRADDGTEGAHEVGVGETDFTSADDDHGDVAGAMPMPSLEMVAERDYPWIPPVHRALIGMIERGQVDITISLTA